MIWQEADLKRHLKGEALKRVYFLFGDEPYLAAHYVKKLVTLAVGDDADGFSVERFDGQTADASDIAAAVMTLPMMADRKCVVVQDPNIAAADEGTMETWLSLLSDLPETCVLIVWLCALTADEGKDSAPKSSEKKGRKRGSWKTFLAAAEKAGAVVQFARPTPPECVRLLMSGAKKRGCELSDRVAALWVERCGTNLHRLVNELDELCALADGGAITEEMVVAGTAETLEAKVFDLSKMILQGNAARAFSILHTLRADKEKP
ncbi:MAG: DNA polymerase III subunit delta, partial [Clostridia bacterium]|nr:DNA polymerase III subunit delta [Clostridia bacterium]